MISNLRKTIFILAGIAGMLGVNAKAGDMIEVGVGGAFATGQERPVEVLLRVEYKGYKYKNIAPFLVLAKLKAGASALDKDASYIDIDFEPVTLGIGNDVLSGYLNIASLAVRRNMNVGNEMMIRVTAVGVRGEFNTAIGKKVDFYLKGAVDLLAVGIFKSGGQTVAGFGMGANAEHDVRHHQKLLCLYERQLCGLLGRKDPE